MARVRGLSVSTVTGALLSCVTCGDTQPIHKFPALANPNRPQCKTCWNEAREDRSRWRVQEARR